MPPEAGVAVIRCVTRALDYGYSYADCVKPRPAPEKRRKVPVTRKGPEERERMILENQGLVYLIARRLAAPGRFEEALSFGQEGLIEAVDRFDPERGAKFSSYSYEYIRGYILRGVYHRSTHWKPTIPVDFSSDHFDLDPGTMRQPPDHRTESPDAAVRRAEIWERIRKYLDPRRYEAIYERYVGGRELEDIGEQLGITRERVRQLIDTGLQSMLNRIPDLIDLLS